MKAAKEGLLKERENEKAKLEAQESQVTLLADREGTETVDIVGGLCSRYDLLASNVTLPRAEVGDRLLFTNAGSYGYTLSPLLFGSQTPPDQLWLEHEIDI